MNAFFCKFSSTLSSRILPRPLCLIAIGFSLACIHTFIPFIAIIIALVSFGIGIITLKASKSAVSMAIFLSLLGFGLGVLRFASINVTSPELVFSEKRLVRITGVIGTLPVIHSYSTLFTLNAVSITTDQSPMAINSKISIRLLGGAADKATGFDEGDQITVSGILTHNPNHYPSQPDLQLVARSPDDISALNSPVNTIGQRISSKLSRYVKSILNSELTPDDSAVMCALLLGNRSQLSQETASAFIETGTAHLLATAGLHVGIIAWTLTSFLRLLTIPRKTSAVICIIFLWIYAVAAGGRPAVERAVFTASVYFAAQLFERIPDLPSALGLCALVTLWISPDLISDSGFLMTFLSVIGIIAIMTAMSHGVDDIFTSFANTWRSRLIKSFVDIELLSVAAQASAAPLVAYFYNIVPIGSVAANLLAVPLMIFLLPMSLVCVLMGALFLPLGRFLAHEIAAPLIHGIVSVISGVASANWASVSVAQPSILEIVGYYVVLIGGSFAAALASNSSRTHSLPGSLDPASLPHTFRSLEPIPEPQP
jgi:ComEC/Rec2-related protein